MKRIGANIRTLRERAGMTQDDLAVKAGVTCPAVSKWERGLAYPRMDTLVLLADIFGVTTDALFGRDQNTA